MAFLLSILILKNHLILLISTKIIWFNCIYIFIAMADQKPLFKAPYDIKDVGALFAIVAFVLIIAAIVGNNLFGLFQQNVNFGWFFECRLDFL